MENKKDYKMIFNKDLSFNSLVTPDGGTITNILRDSTKIHQDTLAHISRGFKSITLTIMTENLEIEYLK